jgi:hypothetical protein
MLDHELIAWSDPKGSDELLAAFVGAPAARQRAPAMQLRSSYGEARQRKAATLEIPVEWAPNGPRS